MLAQCALEVVHQLLHLLLALGWEVFLDIELSHGLAQHRVGHVERVFPARHLHLLAAHGAAVHVEVGVGKGVTQVGRSSVNILEDKVFPDVFFLERLHHLVDLGQRLGLEDAHLVQLADVQAGEILAPVDVGIVGAELVQARYVIEFAVIAGLLTRHCHFGQSGLDGHHVVGGFLGIALLVADELEELLDVVDVGIANLDGIGIIVQVVVTVAHTQAALHEVHHVGVGVLQVGHDCRVEEGRGDAVVLVGDSGHKLVAIERLDLVDIAFERRHALVVQAHAVHAQCVEVAHLLLDAAARVVSSQCGNDFLDLVAAVLGQLVKGSETCILRVQRIVQHPATTGILVEIGTWSYLRVEVVAVHRLDGGTGNCCHCNKCHE